MRSFFLALLGILALCASLAACDGRSGPDPDNGTYSFSFEDGLEGWIPRAFDISVGGEEIDWSITSSAERSTEGARSARIYADNMTDACKVFLERSFAVPPGDYNVDLSFDFATADFGDMNNWSMIVGAGTGAAASPDILGYTDTTGNGEGSDVGFVWLSKSYGVAEAERLAVSVPAGGQAYVQLGVWGTWEAARTYFIDNLTVHFEKVTQ